jgi:hypothetical protein
MCQSQSNPKGLALRNVRLWAQNFQWTSTSGNHLFCTGSFGPYAPDCEPVQTIRCKRPPPFAPVQLRTGAKGGTTWPSVERPAEDLPVQKGCATAGFWCPSLPRQTLPRQGIALKRCRGRLCLHSKHVIMHTHIYRKPLYYIYRSKWHTFMHIYIYIENCLLQWRVATHALGDQRVSNTVWLN